MKERLALLVGFFNKQRGTINQFIGDVRKRAHPSTKEECVYIGYLFHNLYCALEDLFQEIAKTFENQVEDTSRYHRLLLKRMTIDVPQIRPRILSEEGYLITAVQDKLKP